MTGTAACLICGSDRFDVVFSYDRPDPYETAVGIIAMGYARQWVRCEGCEFHYSRYSRDPTALDRLYEGGYRDAGAPWRSESAQDTFKRIVDLPREQSETKERVRWIKTQLAVLPGGEGPRSFLDVGGASGVFAYDFQDREWRGHVVDPSSQGGFIESEYGIPYKPAAYRSGLFGEQFALVSMIYVLEHVRDPRALLSEALKDLAPGGVLYVEVPDAAAFGRKAPEDDIFNACHLWMFSPESLGTLLEGCGYGVLGLRQMQTLRGNPALMTLAGRL